MPLRLPQPVSQWHFEDSEEPNPSNVSRNGKLGKLPRKSGRAGDVPIFAPLTPCCCSIGLSPGFCIVQNGGRWDLTFGKPDKKGYTGEQSQSLAAHSKRKCNDNAREKHPWLCPIRS
jgi:hypothetical protein